MQNKKLLYLLFPFFFVSECMADTRIVSESYNLMSGSLQESVSRVKDGKIRVETSGREKEFHEIIDTEAGKKYLIKYEDDSVIVEDLNRKSAYQDKAELRMIGEGPAMLDEYDTRHYVFRAGNVVCNHVYISKINYPDIDDYLKTFTMVPVKVSGMTVSPEEKACQKAARDAARKITEIGVPLLVRGKDDQETLFSITKIFATAGFNMADFEPALFEVPNIEKAMTAEEAMKKALDVAMVDAMYKKMLERIEQRDMPEAEKNRIREEARVAHEKGEFMEFLKKKAQEEKQK